MILNALHKHHIAKHKQALAHTSRLGVPVLPSTLRCTSISDRRPQVSVPVKLHHDVLCVVSVSEEWPTRSLCQHWGNAVSRKTSIHVKLTIKGYQACIDAGRRHSLQNVVNTRRPERQASTHEQSETCQDAFVQYLDVLYPPLLGLTIDLSADYLRKSGVVAASCVLLSSNCDRRSQLKCRNLLYRKFSSWHVQGRFESCPCIHLAKRASCLLREVARKVRPRSTSTEHLAVWREH